MAKYRTQLSQRFEKRTAVITGFSDGGYCATISFSQVPKTVLSLIADELMNGGYCNQTEVTTDSIELIEPDSMMCEFDGLKAVVKEMLKECNYELCGC